MLNLEETVFIMVDMQERLLPAMSDQLIVTRCTVLLKAAEILGLPIIYTEQLPEKLGPTISGLKESLSNDITTTECKRYDYIS